jgi:hypothetical protein
MKDDLSFDRVDELLAYDPETGLLRWKISRGSRMKGGVAGNRTQKMVQVQIDGGGYVAHRLAWLLMTGTWPETELDHRNLDSFDNRWENLRVATHQQNCCNRRREVRNKSGFKGVHWHSVLKKWRTQIKVNGVITRLGAFNSAEEAYAVYCAAAVKYHGEFRRVA